MAKYESKLYFSGKIHVLIEEYFTKTGITNEFLISLIYKLLCLKKIKNLKLN